MNMETAFNIYGKFHREKYMATLETLLADGRLPGDLIDDLSMAISMSRSLGPPGDLGLKMVNEVLLVAMVQRIPKGKKKK